MAAIALSRSTTTAMIPVSVRLPLSTSESGSIIPLLPSPVSMSPGSDSSIASSTCWRSSSLLPRTAMKIV